METFGLFAFVMVMLLWGKVSRLERTLRENNIRLNGADPGLRLRDRVGQTVTLTLYGDGAATDCKILDMDEEWVHVLRNEGKKNQRELLIRLADVKQIKG